ncbi:hypothetical protein HUJ04_011644 [Dendroctonus ponderosae]|nr:hypothetical protein HUJ04_011644 [Dendroctonus ponderosae]
MNHQPQSYTTESPLRPNSEPKISSRTKYSFVIGAIDTVVLGNFLELLTNPPTTCKYEALKSQIIDYYTGSKDTRISKLLEKKPSGAQKPSQLLREMRKLAGNLFSEDVLKSMWMKQLSYLIQANFITKVEPLNELAKMADCIAKIQSPSTSYRPTAPEVFNIKAAEHEYCWCHWKFASKARKYPLPDELEEAVPNEPVCTNWPLPEIRVEEVATLGASEREKRWKHEVVEAVLALNAERQPRRRAEMPLMIKALRDILVMIRDMPCEAPQYLVDHTYHLVKTLLFPQQRTTNSKFAECHYQEGALPITCSDQATVDWIGAVVKEAKPWTGAALVLVEANKLPKPNRLREIAVRAPKLEGPTRNEEDEDFKNPTCPKPKRLKSEATSYHVSDTHRNIIRSATQAITYSEAALRTGVIPVTIHKILTSS